MPCVSKANALRIFLMSTDSIVPSQSKSHHTQNIASCSTKEYCPLNARTITSTFTIVPLPKIHQIDETKMSAPMSMLPNCGAITNVIECKQLRFGSTVDSLLMPILVFIWGRKLSRCPFRTIARPMQTCTWRLRPMIVRFGVWCS